jgi:putative ABC transport system permease protein
VKDVLHLAWRYLASHRVLTSILVFALTLIMFLPVGLRVLVRQSERELTTRAGATPLILGEKGSPLELALGTLYFAADTPPSLPYAECERVADSGLATAIPMHLRFRARSQPIVGTSLDYLALRGLELGAGRQLALLGDCVVGATAAQELGVAVGGHVISSPENVFDIAGVYPLKMPVVGVLARSHTPDDEAVFVDLKTAWVIAGLGHGHQDMTRPEAASGVLKREGNTVIANASVMQYNEITPENADSFHFHGDLGGFPVQAVIAVPHDEKASALLQGRYLGDDERVQVIRPLAVMTELLDTILTVQAYVVTAVLVVGLATLATAVLVIVLSLRLRKREIDTMVKIGAARGRVAAVLATEIVTVLGLGVLLAAGLTGLTAAYGSELIRALLLS